MEEENRFSLPVFPSVFLPNPKELEHSDKIILPDFVLNHLVNTFDLRDEPLPHPLIFRLRNPELGNTMHCGVLEFSSGVEAAYLPNWMIDDLLVFDGFIVDIQLVSIPKLEYAKFQPLKYEFTEIADPRTALEMALGKFTALTLGQTFTIHYHGKSHKLIVNSLLPESGSSPPAGCLVDTNLNVEFDPPLEEPPKSLEPQKIRINQLVEGSLGPNESEFFMVKVEDSKEAVKFKLIAVEGHPDLYVSTSGSPTPVNHEWHLSTNKIGDELRIEPRDPKYSKSWFYLAVHSYKSPGAFKLKIYHVPAKLESDLSDKKGGLFLGNVSQEAVESDPNYQKCPNCRKFIPIASATMHSLGCERSNWFCEQCNQVIPKKEKEFHVHCPKCKLALHIADLEKHLEFKHGKMKCECGEELEPEELKKHKTESCPLRLEPCKFCSALVMHKEKIAHEQICGSKTIPCEICSKPVPRRRMDVHLAAFHRMNPCLTSSGQRRAENSEESQSSLGDITNNFSNVPLSDLGLSAEELSFMQALESSNKHAEMTEDALLASALQMSAQEAGLSSMDIAAEATEASTSHFGADAVYEEKVEQKSQDSTMELDLPTEVVDIASEDSDWEDMNFPSNPVHDSSVSGLQECPFCDELFPISEIERHVALNHPMD